jgi:hypothetical protein
LRESDFVAMAKNCYENATACPDAALGPVVVYNPPRRHSAANARGEILGDIMASAALAIFFGSTFFGFGPQINIPPDFNTNFLMLVRWIHFLAGITWIGLLYFFNLVNVPLMRELDATTKGKVMPALMTRALWWFRMSAALTVLAGLAYFSNIVGANAGNGWRLRGRRLRQILSHLDGRVGGPLPLPHPRQRHLR